MHFLIKQRLTASPAIFITKSYPLVFEIYIRYSLTNIPGEHSRQRKIPPKSNLILTDNHLQMSLKKLMHTWDKPSSLFLPVFMWGNMTCSLIDYLASEKRLAHWWYIQGDHPQPTASAWYQPPKGEHPAVWGADIQGAYLCVPARLAVISHAHSFVRWG